MSSDRKAILRARGEIPPTEREALSQKLVLRLQEELSERLRDSSWSCVGLFRSHSGEPDLDALADWLADLGIQTAYPRVIDKTRGQMEFLRARPSLAAHWRKGEMGLSEPAPTCLRVDPEELQAILVPGLLFDAQGDRVGHGLGFYDRFLVRFPNALRIGVCWDFQIQTDRIEAAEHDQKMDWVVTELRTLKLPRKESTDE